MDEYITVSAKTLDDAITDALVELGVTSDQLDYIVVEKGSAGFLGIGMKQAVIKARKKQVVPEPEKEKVQPEEQPEKKKESNRPEKRKQKKTSHHKDHRDLQEICAGRPGSYAYGRCRSNRQSR